MNGSRKKKIIRLIALAVILISMTSLSCNITDILFVDREATHEAILATQAAEDLRSTERALEKTQEAINDQATQVAMTATQVAVDVQSTQQAQPSQEYQYQSGYTYGDGQYEYSVVNDTTQTVCYLYMALFQRTINGE